MELFEFWIVKTKPTQEKEHIMKIKLSRKNYHRVMHAIDIASALCEFFAFGFVMFAILWGIPLLAWIVK